MNKQDLIKQSKEQLKNISDSYNIYNKDIVLNAVKTRLQNDVLICDELNELQENKTLSKQEIKLFSEAYDKLYDLNSKTSYSFNMLLETLKLHANIKGYHFILNQKSQKFKLVKSVIIEVVNIGEDFWGRKCVRNVKNNRVYAFVDGRYHTTTKDGEPDCPLKKEIILKEIEEVE